MSGSSDRLSRSFFDREVTHVARDLLGTVIWSASGGTIVGVRLTEVEAYAGLDDPASHAFRGRTPRTAVMFGPAGHLYTYFVYGMHWCANVVTSAAGTPSAVLLRAGEVVAGLETARIRRPRVTKDSALARGPAGLATVLGFDATSGGADLCRADSAIWLTGGSAPARDAVRVGPRVGVSAAADVERRFWIAGDPTVSAFRALDSPHADRCDPAREGGRPDGRCLDGRMSSCRTNPQTLRTEPRSCHRCWPICTTAD